MGRILVTGATGFLGGVLVRHLIAANFDVIATGRNAQALAALPLAKCDMFTWDMARPLKDNVCATLNDVTAIVHCAALSSAWGSMRNFQIANVDGTANCLDLASRLKVQHMVHISTPAVYFTFEDQLDVTETHVLPKPVNAYAETKAIAEQLVQGSSVPFTILRPRGIYGKGDTALFPRLLKAATAGPLPRFRGGVVRTDITHVNDVSEAIVATLRAGSAAQGAVLNVSGGAALPIETIVEKACAATGTRVRWRDLPVAPTLAMVRANEWFAQRRGQTAEPRITAYGLGIFAYSQTLDISRARDVLGWVPTISFDDGLALTFDNYSASRP